MIIVTLTKNSSNFIGETIASIEKQTLKNIHWLVIDSNSEDNTIDIINKSKLKKEVIFIKEQGIFPSYNKAYEIIENKNYNDIVFFLHSNDIIFDEKTLEKVENIFKFHNLDVAYGNIVFFKDNINNLIRHWKINLNNKKKIDTLLYQEKDNLKKDFLLGYSLPHTSFFFNSKIIRNLPKYDENFKICSDYGWIIDLATKTSLKINFIDIIIIKMRVGGLSTNYRSYLPNLYNDFLILKKRFKKFKYINFLLIITAILKRVKKINQIFNKYN